MVCNVTGWNEFEVIEIFRGERIKIKKEVNFPDLMKIEVYLVINALESCLSKGEASCRTNKGRVSRIWPKIARDKGMSIDAKAAKSDAFMCNSADLRMFPLFRAASWLAGFLSILGFTAENISIASKVC
jgi:hypothetical protein